MSRSVKRTLGPGLLILALAGGFLLVRELTSPKKARGATIYYAAPGAGTGCNTIIGWASGTGAIGCPWTLGVALNGGPGGNTVVGGDTIYVRGGTYGIPVGGFVSNLKGTVLAPIIVRNYQDGTVLGERAIIDSGAVPNTNYHGLTVALTSKYTWFWGLDYYNSDAASVHLLSTGSNPPDGRNSGLTMQGTGNRMINSISRSTVNELVTSVGPCTDCEIYGNVSMFSGWVAPDRAHGHSMYLQNTAPSVQTVRNNIGGYAFDAAMQIYGSSSAHLDNIILDGNDSFNPMVSVWDMVHAVPQSYNWILGGAGGVMTNLTFTNNTSYFTKGANANDLVWNALGYNGGGCPGLISFSNNYLGSATQMIAPCAPPSANVVGNTFYGAVSGNLSPANYPSNTYIATANPYRPSSGKQVFVRTNTYDSRRCHVIIFNWDHSSTVTIGTGGVMGDLSGCLANGNSYEIRQAANFYGPPVLTGTFASPSIVVPMTGYGPELPIGIVQDGSTPTTTLPEYGAYVLLNTSGAATPTPTTTPSFTPSFTPSNTNTPTFTPSNTPTFTPSNTPTPNPTQTNTPSPTPTVTPTPQPGQCTYLEAEAGVVVAPMVIFGDVDLSGSFGVSSNSAGNGTVEFTVDGGAGGNYYLWQRGKWPTPNGDSFFTCLNNEGGACAGDTTHIDDTSEQTWVPQPQWTRVTDRAIAGCPLPGNPASCQRTFALSAGNNTIRFRAREAGVSLDKICVAPNQSAQPSDIPQATPTNTPVNTNTPTNTFTPSPTNTLTPTPTPSQTPGCNSVTATYTPTP